MEEYMEQLRLVNPVSLNGDSVYDFDLHMPIPTKSFIQREIGIDLTLATGSEIQADATVRFLTITAMNVIKNNLPTQAKINIEYLIAKSEKHRKAFISTVAFLVLAVRGKGVDTLLSEGKGTLDSISRMARLQAEANDLLVHRYDFAVEDIRVGY
jgi:hypothetical protein